MSLPARLTALERRVPRLVAGSMISNPDESVAVVMVSGWRPEMATRYFTPAAFRRHYPAGEIVKHLILEGPEVSIERITGGREVES